MTAEGIVIDAHGEVGKLLFGCRQRGGGEISGGLWLPVQPAFSYDLFFSCGRARS